MARVYGVGIRKGGQGKSTTVSTLARLCALYGARVLVIDLAQPGSATRSLHDLWPDVQHADLSTLLLRFRDVPPGAAPQKDAVLAALHEAHLPVELAAQPSWGGGRILMLPWDDVQGDAAAYLHSERVLAGIIAALGEAIDLVLIDLPSESGPLLTTALAATQGVIMPLVPETPSLEGVDSMLRVLARARATHHDIGLTGILMTRSDPKNRRVFEIAQAILQADEVEGERIGRKLFPFAVRQVEFFEQAFRYSEPVWERTSNPAHWAPYVLLTEWLLRDADLAHLATNRRGPAILPPEVSILDLSGMGLSDPEIRLTDFARAHALDSQAH